MGTKLHPEFGLRASATHTNEPAEYFFPDETGYLLPPRCHGVCFSIEGTDISVFAEQKLNDAAGFDFAPVGEGALELSLGAMNQEPFVGKALRPDLNELQGGRVRLRIQVDDPVANLGVFALWIAPPSI